VKIPLKALYKRRGLVTRRNLANLFNNETDSQNNMEKFKIANKNSKLITPEKKKTFQNNVTKSKQTICEHSKIREKEKKQYEKFPSLKSVIANTCLHGEAKYKKYGKPHFNLKIPLFFYKAKFREKNTIFK
jgi:hypothetical protein